MEDIKLTPSPNGEDCLGNGDHEGIEIQCDECDFYLTCFPDYKAERSTKNDKTD